MVAVAIILLTLGSSRFRVIVVQLSRLHSQMRRLRQIDLGPKARLYVSPGQAQRRPGLRMMNQTEAPTGRPYVAYVQFRAARLGLLHFVPAGSQGSHKAGPSVLFLSFGTTEFQKQNP